MIFLSDHMVKDKSHDMIRLSDAMDPEQGVLPIRTGMAPGLDKDTKERPRKQDVSGGRPSTKSRRRKKRRDFLNFWKKGKKTKRKNEVSVE
jgi:hypothetical protein